MCCKLFCVLVVSTILVQIMCQGDDKSDVNDDECKLLINEINMGSPSHLKTQDFVELKMTCHSERKSNSLQGYKVIGISAGPDTKDPTKQAMAIDFVANLWNEKLKNNDFFTIGSANVPNVDLSSKSNLLKYRGKLTGNSNSMISFLSIGNMANTHLHAIAVLYKKGYAFPELVITQEKAFLYINDNIQELIKENLIDLVVYTRKAPFETCEFFTRLHENFINKHYVLREFDNNKKNKDRSLNRCADDGKAFTPERFKLGSPTPGRENDCSGIHFFLEQILPEINDPVQNVVTVPDDVDEFDFTFEQTDSPKCTSSDHASVYENLPDDKIEEVIEHQSQIASTSSCTAINLPVNSGNVADEADRMNQRKRLQNPTLNYEGDWETTQYFK